MSASEDADPQRSLAELLSERCARDPLKPLVIDERGSHSFDAVQSRARGVAAALVELPCAPRDRVAIVLPNGVDYVVALFGILLAGCTAVPVDPHLHPRELSRLLRLCACRAVIGELRSDTELPVSCPALELGALRGAGSVSRAANETEPAVILCTSGSTLSPKAVILAHRSLYENQRAFGARYELAPEDVVLTPLSLAHSFGLTACLLAAVGAGAALALVDEPLPGRVAALARQHGATALVAPASFYQYLVRSPACTRDELATCRRFIAGACNLTPAVAKGFRDRFGREILQTYGLTEASPVVTANPPDDNRIGTVGTALPGVELRVERGELCVRGEMVMLGYFANPSATRDCLDESGWLHTGDIAHIDDDGYVELRGRSKDLIIRGGAKIFPEEIEEVLGQHPLVAEVAVVGMPDPVYEEVPVAFVVPVAGGAVDAEALRTFCRAHLANYKVPRLFRAQADLPRTANGKLLRRELRDTLAREAREGARK